MPIHVKCKQRSDSRRMQLLGHWVPLSITMGKSREPLWEALVLGIDDGSTNAERSTREGA